MNERFNRRQGFDRRSEPHRGRGKGAYAANQFRKFSRSIRRAGGLTYPGVSGQTNTVEYQQDEFHAAHQLRLLDYLRTVFRGG
jgi:hypothetical protein